MAVTIGHASLDEHGKTRGGAAGDQTGQEVCIRSYYNMGHHLVLRPKTQDTAEKIAAAVEDACQNPRIGYDQGQRNTLRQQAAASHFNLAAIRVPCECDCSSLMAVCAEAAGIDMEAAYSGGNAPTTSTMRRKFAATGAFEVLTAAKYLTSSDYLKRGDILVKEGSHTVCVLSDGAKSASSSGTPSPSAPPSSAAPGLFQTGEAVTVNGTLYATAKGSGNRIEKHGALMYVTELANSKIYPHFVGLAASKGKSRQGWASPDILQKDGQKPAAPDAPTAFFPAASYTGCSIIDGLKSVGADSSLAYRKQIAAANRIPDYQGSGEQNKQMLALLKSGHLIKPDGKTV